MHMKALFTLSPSLYKIRKKYKSTNYPSVGLLNGYFERNANNVQHISHLY